MGIVPDAGFAGFIASGKASNPILDSSSSGSFLDRPLSIRKSLRKNTPKKGPPAFNPKP